MNKRRYIQAGWSLLLLLLLLSLAVVPAESASAQARAPYRKLSTWDAASTPINATIYLTSATLQPLFQNNIDQAVPTAVNNAIAGVVDQLPAADQGWASQMASALLQPSVTLMSLQPQKNGIVTSLRLSLYAGDPQPINAQILVTFSVLDSTTIQVSAQPLNGSPALMNGPLMTFQIPVGQLSSIAAAPSCGDASLAIGMQVPISLGQGQSGQVALSAPLANAPLAAMQPLAGKVQRTALDASAPTDSYIEIPASSLAALGNSIGTLTIDPNSNLTAQNMQLSVQGSNLVINADIFLGSIQIGTATSTVAPTAANGNLNVNVLSTTLTVLQIFTFPEDSYNAQIEQTINSKLNGALTGKFNVTNAAIGPNSHVPCAASDSLVLTGTTNPL
jgi:hypothetical protein